MTECKHIHGLEQEFEYSDGRIEPAYLARERSDDISTPFKYCPLCGTELKPEVGE